MARALSFALYSLPVALSLAVVGVGLAVAAADGVVLLGADAAAFTIAVVASDATLFGAVDTDADRRQQNETQENDVFHFQRDDSIVSTEERN